MLDLLLNSEVIKKAAESQHLPLWSKEARRDRRATNAIFRQTLEPRRETPPSIRTTQAKTAAPWAPNPTIKVELHQLKLWPVDQCPSIRQHTFKKFTMESFLTFLLLLASAQAGKTTHYIHWNRANPMFRLDNTDHIIDVNSGNLPWEYDQVNIICPVSKAEAKYPERHVIYSVSREEYESCRITNPKPRIVAVCNKPHQLLYVTITFRSFSPTPGGLEFHPGQDYYFISTSSPEDLHRRVGGGCSTHNMKMIN